MGKFLIIFLSFVLSLINPIEGNSQHQETADNAISVFADASGKYLFRTKINYKDKVLSGMIIIRKSANNSYRIAMVTELGMTIFEMEFFANKEKPFILHSCINYLNKKVIINTLRRDFESIFLNFTNWEEAKIINNSAGTIHIFHYEGKRKYYCNKYGDIEKIIRSSWLIKKEVIYIQNTKNPYPRSITIEHQHNRLSIMLTFIK